MVEHSLQATVASSIFWTIKSASYWSMCKFMRCKISMWTYFALCDFVGTKLDLGQMKHRVTA